MATTDNVKGSPVGVMTAARMTIITTACRRYRRRKVLCTSPSRDNSHVTSGNSKARPMQSTSIMKLLM